MANLGELRNKFSTIALEQIRANVRRTIMSYRSSWDIYTELLQNALDAIIDKYGYENISNGKITLSFNTENREIYIKDNGIGIKHSDISSILVMGESIKRKEGRGKYGFMGYGFTFVSFQTNYLKIESIHNGKKASRTYKDLYKVIFENGELPLSEEEKNSIKEEDTNEESGTKITIRFPSDFPNETLEKNINSAFYHATSEPMLEYILRTKSAIGIVDNIFNKELDLFSIHVEVNGKEVVIDSGHLTTRELLKKMYPSGNFYNIDEYNTFVEMTEHLDQSARRVARKAMLIDGTYNNISIGTVNPLNVNIYIAETSKGHLSTYNDKFSNDDKFENLSVNNGIWLSIDGLPTGICLDPLSHGSYLPFTVIVDVIDESKDIKNELDSGRKGITEYRAGQIVKVVKKILKEKRFVDYREYVLGVDTRVNTDGYDAKRNLRNKLESKQKFNLDLVHQYFPVDNEQEVITLFTELISRGLLPGYFPKVISGFDVYDGLYDYKTNFPDEILLPNDPLGISDSVKVRHPDIDREVVIEYKTFLRGIFRDLKEVKKRLQDIDILVCWSVEYEKLNEFVELEGIVLKGVDQSENFYYGVTHEVAGLGRNTNFLPVIELKTVLSKIFGIYL
ncbi:ATP-binding protein [Guptibacillus algicola]|uniref:ATP-binding protein n=1 Tax=Guptibacillus algicola TaxID=225844 RepID=UPI001CD4D422|nr:ATP-binding protein [Alkalihalobacillus algicola]MCA0987261.1 ATP-binding protein [Alkalihalobacillus algicola]